MNYVLTEDEFNRLESVRGMLNLVLGLLAVSELDCGHFRSTDLHDFLSVQRCGVDSLLKEMEARRQAQRALEKEGDAMRWFDWMHALRIASGRGRHCPRDAEEAIGRKLERAAQVDEEMRAVLKEWRAIFERQETAPA